MLALVRRRKNLDGQGEGGKLPMCPQVEKNDKESDEGERGREMK